MNGIYNLISQNFILLYKSRCSKRPEVLGQCTIGSALPNPPHTETCRASAMGHPFEIPRGRDTSGVHW